MVIAEWTQLNSTCYSHTTGTLPWCYLAENCLSRQKLFLSIICLARAQSTSLRSPPASPAAPASTVSGLIEVICAHTQQAGGTIKDRRNVLAEQSERNKYTNNVSFLEPIKVILLLQNLNVRHKLR